MRIKKLPRELLIDIIVDLSNALSKASGLGFNSSSGYNFNNLTISSNLSGCDLSTASVNLSSSPTPTFSLQQTYQQLLYNNNFNENDSLSQK